MKLIIFLFLFSTLLRSQEFSESLFDRPSSKDENSDEEFIRQANQLVKKQPKKQKVVIIAQKDQKSDRVLIIVISFIVIGGGYGIYVAFIKEKEPDSPSNPPLNPNDDDDDDDNKPPVSSQPSPVPVPNTSPVGGDPNLNFIEDMDDDAKNHMGEMIEKFRSLGSSQKYTTKLEDFTRPKKQDKKDEESLKAFIKKINHFSDLYRSKNIKLIDKYRIDIQEIELGPPGEKNIFGEIKISTNDFCMYINPNVFLIEDINNTQKKKNVLDLIQILELKNLLKQVNPDQLEMSKKYNNCYFGLHNLYELKEGIIHYFYEKLESLDGKPEEGSEDSDGKPKKGSEDSDGKPKEKLEFNDDDDLAKYINAEIEKNPSKLVQDIVLNNLFSQQEILEFSEKVKKNDLLQIFTSYNEEFTKNINDFQQAFKGQVFNIFEDDSGQNFEELGIKDSNTDFEIKIKINRNDIGQNIDMFITKNGVLMRKNVVKNSDKISTGQIQNYYLKELINTLQYNLDYSENLYLKKDDIIYAPFNLKTQYFFNRFLCDIFIYSNDEQNKENKLRYIRSNFMNSNQNFSEINSSIDGDINKIAHDDKIWITEQIEILKKDNEKQFQNYQKIIIEQKINPILKDLKMDILFADEIKNKKFLEKKLNLSDNIFIIVIPDDNFLSSYKFCKYQFENINISNSELNNLENWESFSLSYLIKLGEFLIELKTIQDKIENIKKSLEEITSQRTLELHNMLKQIQESGEFAYDIYKIAWNNKKLTIQLSNQDITKYEININYINQQHNNIINLLKFLNNCNDIVNLIITLKAIKNLKYSEKNFYGLIINNTQEFFQLYFSDKLKDEVKIIEKNTKIPSENNIIFSLGMKDLDTILKFDSLLKNFDMENNEDIKDCKKYLTNLISLKEKQEKESKELKEKEQKEKESKELKEKEIYNRPDIKKELDEICQIFKQINLLDNSTSNITYVKDKGPLEDQGSLEYKNEILILKSNNIEMKYENNKFFINGIDYDTIELDSNYYNGFLRLLYKLNKEKDFFTKCFNIIEGLQLMKKENNNSYNLLFTKNSSNSSNLSIWTEQDEATYFQKLFELLKYDNEFLEFYGLIKKQSPVEQVNQNSLKKFQMIMHVTESLQKNDEELSQFQCSNQYWQEFLEFYNTLIEDIKKLKENGSEGENVPIEPRMEEPALDMSEENYVDEGSDNEVEHYVDKTMNEKQEQSAKKPYTIIKSPKIDLAEDEKKGDSLKQNPKPGDPLGEHQKGVNPPKENVLVPDLKEEISSAQQKAGNPKDIQEIQDQNMAQKNEAINIQKNGQNQQQNSVGAQPPQQPPQQFIVQQQMQSQPQQIQSSQPVIQQQMQPSQPVIQQQPQQLSSPFQTPFQTPLIPQKNIIQPTQTEAEEIRNLISKIQNNIKLYEIDTLYMVSNINNQMYLYCKINKKNEIIFDLYDKLNENEHYSICLQKQNGEILIYCNKKIPIHLCNNMLLNRFFPNCLEDLNEYNYTTGQSNRENMAYNYYENGDFLPTIQIKILTQMQYYLENMEKVIKLKKIEEERITNELKREEENFAHNINLKLKINQDIGIICILNSTQYKYEVSYQGIPNSLEDINIIFKKNTQNPIHFGITYNKKTTTIKQLFFSQLSKPYIIDNGNRTKDFSSLLYEFFPSLNLDFNEIKLDTYCFEILSSIDDATKLIIITQLNKYLQNSK